MGIRDRNLSPIAKKAEEIYKLTNGLMHIIPEEDEYLQATKGFMLENSMVICAKIAGAEGVGLYDLRMENAAIIRKAAREIYVQAGALRYEGVKDVTYIELLRKEIDEFRLLFIDWVAGFDPWDYIIDRWGLFNPPGVTAHDIDPDDDIPFNPEDFMDFDED
jgi:hypothetical protein